MVYSRPLLVEPVRVCGAGWPRAKPEKVSASEHFAGWIPTLLVGDKPYSTARGRAGDFLDAA